MELAGVNPWPFIDDVVRIGILIAVIANIALLIWITSEVKSIVTSWRVQHEQRTPVAAAYGMALVLQSQGVELPFEARVKIYNALVEQLAAAVRSLDAGSYMEDL